MEQRDAEQLVGQLNSNYKMGLDYDEFGKRMWMRYMIEQDVLLASEAVKRVCGRQRERATIADIRQMVVAVASDRLAAAPALPEPQFTRELPGWVKGWLIGRSRRDYRVWPEQKPGYDSLQREHSGTRTHVWPEQNLMPAEDRAKYETEGAHLSASQIGSLLEAAVGI